MARVVVSSIVSLDGYFEGPTHGVMDLPMDPAFDRYNLERLRSADTVLLGATSYRFFGGYWPGVQHQPPAPLGADPMIVQALSDDCRAISRRYDEVDILVVSDTLTLDSESPWRDRTTVVARAELKETVQSRDGECVVFGSRTLVNALLAQDLVTEVHLMIGPRWLGGGTPYLDSPRDLELQDVRRFDDSSNLVLVYRPAPPADAATPGSASG